MDKFNFSLKGLVCTFLLIIFSLQQESQAQTTINGVMFLDYEYQLANPDEAVVGNNGFNYRRWRITGNYKLSDTFSGRVRLEGSGTKDPFVKDLFLKWKDGIGEGRDLYFGVAPPPLWQVSEKFWGFRSLEATLLDKNKVASSRDFGVKSLGNITADGKFRYGVMFANNESVRVEEDKHKRVYGQLEFHPNENMAFTVEADYGPTEEDNRSNMHAFAGFKNSNFHGGFEIFKATTSPKDNSPNVDFSGFSLFGALTIAEKTKAILRADLTSLDSGSGGVSHKYYLAGVSYQVEKGVTFIPNVVLNSEEGLDTAVTGRITLEAKF